MSSAIFSNSWYRVALLRPRLRGQARVLRHFYRGQRWHILQDRASGRFLRLNPAAYGVVSMFDGFHSLDEIWKHLCERNGDNAPTQDEIVQLLNQLHQANVLLTDRSPDLEDMSERRSRVHWQKLKQYIANPLSLKIPLFDPDRLLRRILALVPRWFMVMIPWLWLILVVSGAIQAAMHWDELTRDLTARAFTAENILLLWFVFPILKAVHEMGHGLVVKHHGGACHEMGLMFLVLVPVPYVDASATIAFPDKFRRMQVGAAGMMAELAVASVAMALWVEISPGLGRAILHEIILVAGLTTLIFNINPLIRFDGYYIFSDALEIPNLGQKSNQYLGHIVHRHLFGVAESQPPPMTPGEAAWLLVYAVASFFYRMFIAVAIILLVAGNYFFIGVLLAFWSAWGMLIAPLWRQIKSLATSPSLEGHRLRAAGLSGLGAVLLLIGIGLVPVSAWTMTEGVIWMPEESRIRAPLHCLGDAVLRMPGTDVRTGEPLLTCADPELEARHKQLRQQRREVASRLELAATFDRMQAQIAAFELDHVAEQLADLESRRKAMTMTSPHEGMFVMAAPVDYPGRYLKRGDVVAFVLDPSRFTLLAVVPQGAVDLVRHHTLGVELRAVDRIWDLLPARIVREVPAATHDLPSLALSLAGGGTIGLNPDAPEPKALTPLFQFELAFSGDRIPKALGNRIHVRFVHEDAPLAVQWYRELRQLFLKRFAV
ncbi:MAG: PqqD family peptide modification chaperone [Magnetococcales bacterium]|nr:PqqD family peptide modification chaperone [Magnetococcales bacterium]